MSKEYVQALLTYVAMDRLLEEYRGRQDGQMLEYRSAIHDQKLKAEITISEALGFKGVFHD